MSDTAKEIAGALAAFLGGYTEAKGQKRRDDREDEQWKAYHDLAIQKMEQSERIYQDEKSRDEWRKQHELEKWEWEQKQVGAVSANTLISQGYAPEKAVAFARGEIKELGESPDQQLRRQAWARAAAGGGGGSGGRSGGGSGGMDYTAAQTAKLDQAAAMLGIPIGSQEYFRIFKDGFTPEQEKRLSEVMNMQGIAERIKSLRAEQDDMVIRSETNGLGRMGSETTKIYNRNAEELANLEAQLERMIAPPQAQDAQPPPQAPQPKFLDIGKAKVMGGGVNLSPSALMPAPKRQTAGTDFSRMAAPNAATQLVRETRPQLFDPFLGADLPDAAPMMSDDERIAQKAARDNAVMEGLSKLFSENAAQGASVLPDDLSWVFRHTKGGY